MLDTVFILITWSGSMYILIPVTLTAGALLLYRQRYTDTALLTAGVIGASLLSHFSKELIGRSRPPAEEMLISAPASYSFPSAHAAQITAFILASLIIYSKGASRPPQTLTGSSLLLVALVGYSRIYLGVHYVSDVLAGILLGAVWIYLCKLVTEHFR